MAYNPYSHFYVGASVLGLNEKIFSGANIENSSYGLTLCAERAALTEANNHGIRKLQGIAIVTRGEDFNTTMPSMSCGACRQWIYEFAQISSLNLFVISANTDLSKIVMTSISELLPGAFGPQDLEIDLDNYRT